MPNAIFRIVAPPVLALTTSFLFYTPAHEQTYSVNGAPIEISLAPSLRSLSKYNTDSAIEGIKRGMRVSHEEMREAGNRYTAISFAGHVRSAAAHALSKSKHREALSLLISMRKDDHWAVRLTVVHSLGELGTPEAITILQEMSKDEHEDVSREANRYLSTKEKN